MKLLVFPLDWNPYQRLLYDAMRDRDPQLKVRYLRRSNKLAALNVPLELAWWRLLGYRTIHIHWPAFFVTFPKRFSRQLSTVMAFACLRFVELLGMRVIYTVHDIVPHEPETTDDQAVTRRIVAMSDPVIVHSRAVRAELEQLGCETARAVVIPHGNYDGVYRGGRSRAQARAQLGMRQDEFVVLFFGIIRPYKGVENLIRTLEALHLPRLHLLIVGAGATDTLTAAIAASTVTITHVDRRVDDDEVATYFEGADLVCLPFTAIATSGSVLLALTFSRAIVVPASGGLAELPRDVGWLYGPADPQGLAHALSAAYGDREELARRERGAAAYAATLSWPLIAQATLEAYG